MNEFLLGLLGGLIAPAIYTYVLSRMRPNIKIGTQMARTQSKNSNEMLTIKIANMSMQDAIEIKAELFRAREETINNCKQRIMKRIELLREDPLILYKYNPDRNDTLHTYVFRTKEGQDIGGILGKAKSCKILFRIIASHPYSHFSKVFEKLYDPENDIVYGRFIHGHHFSVVPALTF